MSTRRVVITGLGVISPVGLEINTFWDNLLQGRTGIGKIDRFDATDYPTQIAAQIRDFKAEDYILRKDARRMDLFVQYACAAARMAVQDANLSTPPEEAHRTGVWIATGIGGVETFEKQYTALQQKGVAGVSPFFIPMFIPNMASGQVSIMIGARGPNACTVTACASGTNSIGEAFRVIQHNKADVMITGGTEAAITPMSIAGFCAMKALSTRNDEPEKACRPFDLNRQGFVMGEGAGVVILEELQHALDRGAHIYAELIGYGSSADAYHMVQPEEDGKGAVLALQTALDDAGISPEEVDYINAHGTGTKLNDFAETQAIKKVFGQHSYNMLVSSTKPATGHMLGAAGAVELIASVLTLNHNLVPPTQNLETPDPLCDLDYVPGEARARDMQVALSESLGFGGHNAVLIIRKM
ncbi:MAG: beta-ketoacyl-ACP synthase II [Syntrophomonadaceae bacterium]